MIALVLLIAFLAAVLLMIFLGDAFFTALGVFVALLGGAIKDFETGSPLKGILLLVMAGVVAVLVWPAFWLVANFFWLWIR